MTEQHELIAAVKRLSSGEGKEQQDIDLLTEFINETFSEKDEERWTPSLKELPKTGKRVWCAVIDHDLKRHVFRGHYHCHSGWSLDNSNRVHVLKVTHWKESLPLPKLPPLEIKEDC